MSREQRCIFVECKLSVVARPVQPRRLRFKIEDLSQLRTFAVCIKPYNPVVLLTCKQDLETLVERHIRSYWAQYLSDVMRIHYHLDSEDCIHMRGFHRLNPNVSEFAGKIICFHIRHRTLRMQDMAHVRRPHGTTVPLVAPSFPDDFQVSARTELPL